MDIAILAGGYGTRLKGIWDRPKCLIPYQGRPLIEFLVNQALELKPRRVFLLLGHKASEVVAWREGCCPHRYVVPIIETKPEGTASAIRSALPFMKCPLMVLNGDTIPFYNLIELTRAFDIWQRTVVAWSNGRHAGASLFHVHDVHDGYGIESSTESNLEACTNNMKILKVMVSGFLDVGTPDGFHKSQQLLTWPKDYDGMEHT